jgi:hypothetical protein
MIQFNWYFVFLWWLVSSFLQGALTIWIFYGREKGKNIATKEDIESITKLQEGVKAEFTKGIEKVKSELSLLNDHKFSLANEERNAIFKFIDACAQYQFRASLYYLYEYTDENYARWQELLSEAHMQYKVADGRLSLFIDDDNFSDLKDEFSDLIVVLENSSNIGIVKVLGFENILRILSKSTVAGHLQEYEQVTNEKTEEFQKAADAFLENYNPTLGPMRKILDYLNAHLKKIFENQD